MPLLRTEPRRKTVMQDATTEGMTATEGAEGQERDVKTGNSANLSKDSNRNTGRKNRRAAMRPSITAGNIAATGKIMAALLFALLCQACSQPVKEYSFATLNRIKGWQNDTGAVLAFDMTDTTNACELYIVGEIATGRTIQKEKGYPVNITFAAPDGTYYTDSVFLPLYTGKEGGIISHTSNGIMEIEWPYRKNIYNKIPGQWKIIFTKGDTLEDYSNIIGLGIYCKQKEL
jgi:hypothetical protein